MIVYSHFVIFWSSWYSSIYNMELCLVKQKKLSYLMKILIKKIFESLSHSYFVSLISKSNTKNSSPRRKRQLSTLCRPNTAKQDLLRKRRAHLWNLWKTRREHQSQHASHPAQSHGRGPRYKHHVQNNPLHGEPHRIFTTRQAHGRHLR